MRDFPGGLFHPSDDKQEVAFRYAVEKINANRDILPKSRLSAQIEQIKPQDSFHASKRGECGGPRFSPSPQTDSKKTRSACSAFWILNGVQRGFQFSTGSSATIVRRVLFRPPIAVFSTRRTTV